MTCIITSRLAITAWSRSHWLQSCWLTSHFTQSNVQQKQAETPELIFVKRTEQYWVWSDLLAADADYFDIHDRDLITWSCWCLEIVCSDDNNSRPTPNLSFSMLTPGWGRQQQQGHNTTATALHKKVWCCVVTMSVHHVTGPRPAAGHKQIIYNI